MSGADFKPESSEDDPPERDGLYPDEGDESGGPAGGHVVTALRSLKRDPTRVSVCVGKRFLTRLRRKDAEELGIRVGVPWTPQLEAAAIEAGERDRARLIAHRSLARRGQSRGELIFRLKRRGYSESVGEFIANECSRIGLIDDEAYGRSVLRELVRARPAGERLMRQRLIRKRLDQSLIDRLVTEALEGTDQTEAIDGLIERKLRTMDRLDERTQARRLIGLLARRGFDPETIRESVWRHLEGSRGRKDPD